MDAHTGKSKGTALRQGVLWALLTVVLGCLVRLLGGGWYLVLFGIPLLAGAVAHLVVHGIVSWRRSPPGDSPMRLMLLSNLFFFLGYSLQPDATDAPGYHIVLLVVLSHWRIGEFPNDSVWITISWIVSGVFLLGMLVTWVRLLSSPQAKPDAPEAVRPA